MDSTITAEVFGAVAAIAGAVIGALATWLAAERGAKVSDRRSELRERRLEDLRYRRAVLSDRLNAQRSALAEVQRVSAECGHSMTHEAEFRMLHVKLVHAFGLGKFADKILDALDESCEAAKGSPSPNAGLSVTACIAVMTDLVRGTEAQLSVSELPHDDAMHLYDKALMEEQRNFAGLFNSGNNTAGRS